MAIEMARFLFKSKAQKMIEAALPTGKLKMNLR